MQQSHAVCICSASELVHITPLLRLTTHNFRAVVAPELLSSNSSSNFRSNKSATRRTAASADLSHTCIYCRYKHVCSTPSCHEDHKAVDCVVVARRWSRAHRGSRRNQNPPVSFDLPPLVWLHIFIRLKVFSRQGSFSVVMIHV